MKSLGLLVIGSLSFLSLLVAFLCFGFAPLVLFASLPFWMLFLIFLIRAAKP